LFATSYLLGSHRIDHVVTMQDGRELLPYLAQHRVGMIFLDLYMPGISGLELLPKLVQQHPEVPVVVMTASQDVETAVACMRDGAFDYLVADTLFGHVRGAFTGADRDRPGAIAQAAGGSLFLDEIGDLGKASQVKLLRLLQEQRYYPLGSDLQQRSDARVVAATNQPLHKRMARGKFRQDLYFRLSSHPIEIPPLRERPDDIALLVQHFIDEAADSLGRQAPSAPDELITLMCVYEFPGNVRELRAMIYNALALHRGGPVLSMDSFRELIKRGRGQPVDDRQWRGRDGGAPITITGRFPSLKEAEDFLVDEAMRRAKDNQGIAATLLGMTRQSLNRRLQNRRQS